MSMSRAPLILRNASLFDEHRVVEDLLFYQLLEFLGRCDHRFQLKFSRDLSISLITALRPSLVSA